MCDPPFDHDGPIVPVDGSYVPIEEAFAIHVRCESCGRIGEAVIDIVLDVEWLTDEVAGESLVCSECGTIGNADDLAFFGAPCPRSWYEDDDCSGVMRRLEET